MYIPPKFKQQDKSCSIEAMREIQFGALIIFADNRFISSHIPFMVKVENDVVILEGHVAKTNELWHFAKPQNQAMVIFQGPNTYIHPGWYPTKKETEKVVPTWNYQVVHGYGYAESRNDEEWLSNNITELTEYNERHQKNPWHVTDAPVDHIKTLLKFIVGIKVYINNIESALKMNQNQIKDNRLGVINGLNELQMPSAACKVSEIMQRLEIDRDK